MHSAEFVPASFTALNIQNIGAGVLSKQFLFNLWWPDGLHCGAVCIVFIFERCWVTPKSWKTFTGVPESPGILLKKYKVGTLQVIGDA